MPACSIKMYLLHIYEKSKRACTEILSVRGYIQAPEEMSSLEPCSTFYGRVGTNAYNMSIHFGGQKIIVELQHCSLY